MSDPNSFNDIDNLDHDPEIASALGNMVVAWAKAETILCYCFAIVFDIHPNKAFLTFYHIPNSQLRAQYITQIQEIAQKLL